MPFPLVLYPPNGTDRADGSRTDPYAGPIGTATPDAAIVARDGEGGGRSGYHFEELPDSPDIERAEQGTIRHRFSCDNDTGLVLIEGLGRGTIQKDSSGNVTRVVSSRLSQRRGEWSELEVISESLSFDTPPDEFRLEIVEQNPALEKHPRYAFLTAKQRHTIDQAINTENLFSRDDFENAVSVFPAGNQRNAAYEVLFKRKIGEDTFQLPGFRCVWSQFFFKPVYLNPGGYIEDPIRHGGLPEYFWNPNWPTPPTSPDVNIFTLCASANPQFFASGGSDDSSNPDGISWLRQCDTIDYSRTWFKVTHSWLGAPYAHWDGQIYSPDISPYPRPPSFPIA